MKRSEYKKLLLEFLQLNESSGTKKLLLRETIYQVKLKAGDEYFKLNPATIGDWDTIESKDDVQYTVDTVGEPHLNAKIDNDGDLQFTDPTGTYAIRNTHYEELTGVQEEEKTPQEKETELKSSGYEYFGYVTIKSTSYIVWNKQDEKQLILADEDAEKKYFFKDSSINNGSPNIDSQLSNVTLTRDASGKPKSFDYEESGENFSATIDTRTTTFPAATTTAKKKALSQSAIGSIKEIQKIIKAPSSDDGTKPGDGKWGKKTQAAFVKYLSANSEALKEKEIDDPGKFASDAAYMKEKLGKLGHPKNVKGVLELLESLEVTEDGETTSATSKEDNDYLISLKFRNKYYKDENNDFYYVDADGKYVYKDTFEFETFGAEPFASFNSKDKIRVPGQVEDTTVEVSKWGNTVDKIHYEEWTEITEEEAEALTNKEEEAAPAAAPAPNDAEPKTRREKRRNRRKARLQKRLNRLQETNMNEKLINEMKKGKASLLNLLNEQVPEKMDKPDGGGETPKQKPAKKKGWDYYVSVGKTTDDKEQRRTLANLWKNISGKTEYAKDSIEVLSYDDSIYPGDFGSDLKDFSAWYKKVLPLEIKNGDGEVVKEKGANFNVEESNKIILLLLADAGATPKTIAGFRIPSETLAVFKDALQMIQNDQGSTKAATTKEKIEESLSRGSLYRRRYHGRY